MGYRIVDHTADQAIEAWAPDFGELLRQCARGLLALIGETAELQPTQFRVIRVEASDRIELLHDMLSELLYLVEDEDLLPVSIGEIEVAGGSAQLKAGVIPLAMGDAVVSGNIKAVTYHELEIVSDGETLRTRVVFDT